MTRFSDFQTEAWFITWFQEVRNSDMGTTARDVSLGYYLAVLTRCWLLIELASELLRCVLWFVEAASKHRP